MEKSIKELQIEVYRLDWRIGEAAHDLQRDLENEDNFTKNGNIEYYNSCIAKRQTLIECIEKLKAL